MKLLITPLPLRPVQQALLSCTSNKRLLLAARHATTATSTLTHSYSDTILMPKTDFPVRTDRKKVQERFGKIVSDDLYDWQKSTLPKDKLFILHDGPPYANADVHLGHAVNKITKDIILRYQILQGRQVSFIPGWDCHGLPIELKVLEKIGKRKAERLSATELRKLARMHAQATVSKHMKNFREWGTLGDWDQVYLTMQSDYEIRQLQVFKAMVKSGLIYRRFRPVYWSCQSRTALAEAELEYADDHVSTSAFVTFKLRDSQALVDYLTANHAGVHVRPDSLSALIWTTTPWTIPSNKAIAVNPELTYSLVRLSDNNVSLIADARVQALKQELSSTNPEYVVLASAIPGQILTTCTYVHPLFDRVRQPILPADHVSPDSGTGLVHTAPGHGMDDYLLGQKHGIAPYSPVNDAGEFTAAVAAGCAELHAALVGKKVLTDGQQAVLDLLSSAGALAGVNANYKHKYPYDWRSKRPVVIRATAQWFADVESIKQEAVRSLDKVEFVPETGKHRLSSFTLSRSEWCISRQRVWGVPIPALFDADTGEPLMTESSVEHIIGQIQTRGIESWFEVESNVESWVAPEYQHDGKKYVKGTDTMDVWFDSGTSWKLVQDKYGDVRDQNVALADVYLEGSDQHRGWFQSSLLTYAAANGGGSGGGGVGTVSTPLFRTVITHGFTLDDNGKKMSKSLGNVVVPAQITTTGYAGVPPLGVSGLRLWVAQSEYTTDMAVSKVMLQRVSDSLSKIRRTFRYILGNLNGFNQDFVSYEHLNPFDKLALFNLYHLQKETKEYYDKFAFSRVVQAVNNHLSQLSTSYFTISKDRLYTDDAKSLYRRSAQTVLAHLLQTYLAILSPIVPLLTQEVWQYTPDKFKPLTTSNNTFADSPFAAGWVTSPQEWDNELIVHEFVEIGLIQDKVKALMERARQAKVIGSSLEADVVITVKPGTHAFEFLRKHETHLPELLVASNVTIVPVGKADRDRGSQDRGEWTFSAPAGGNGQDEQLVIKNEPVTVQIVKPRHHKCPRCWQFRANHADELCGRCDGVVGSCT
ncbi:tRNA synthetases class I-domain-containing protein [Lipomyces japonicus]|uniref:tRNA synthetases class I-domain-containing protein n=1 Tax=Lipomyces japonicus TaxID=56871 RepID=UPI0034CD5354